MASTGTRRPRKAKKAVLVIDAIAQAPEPEVAPAKAKRPRSAPRKKPLAEPMSAAHAALLAAIEASGEGGVIYTPSAPRSEPSLHSGSVTSDAESIVQREPVASDAESVRQREAVAADAEIIVPAEAQPGLGARAKAILEAVDKLPPIRLPLGPSIPWRLGLPSLLGLVLIMLVLGRPTAHAETNNSFKLPAESETYAVTQDSPLFTKSQQQPAQPIGVAEPAGLNVDVLDLTLKLAAVLALAYGSLVVLKRLGVGGAGSGGTQGQSTSIEGLRVLSTLALAPNRSIHVVRAPDGKTLLLGATPGQVNLIAELGEVPELETAGAGSFLDILTSKLQQH